MKSSHLFCVFSLISSHGLAQQFKAEFVTSECSLACGAQFTYNSKVSFDQDTLKLITYIDGSEVVSSQYVIAQNNSKWKTVNYDGTSIFKVTQVSNSSLKRIKLVLKNGDGYLKIYGRGECEIELKLSNESKLTADNKH